MKFAIADETDIANIHRMFKHLALAWIWFPHGMSQFIIIESHLFAESVEVSHGVLKLLIGQKKTWMAQGWAIQSEVGKEKEPDKTGLNLSVATT